MTDAPKLRLAHDYAFVLLSEEELELQLYGRIGNSFFEEGITAKLVADTLAKSPRAKRLKVNLSSPGGNVGDGMAIRSMLASHAAHVTMNIEGLAASAGSVIAMSGDVIRIHDGASLMLHEGQTMAQGNAAALQRQIAALETINDGAATIYAARTGKTKDEIRQLMAAETWLTPAQALADGFVDEVVPAKKKPGATMYFDLGQYQYQNVPPDIAARCELSARRTPGKQRETEDTMTTARIALALGLPDGAEEDAILKRIDMHKTESARHFATVSAVLELSGADTAPEALGVLRAYAQDHEKLTAVEQTLAQKDKQLEDQEREAILKADAIDPKGHKLTPATIEFWKAQPVSMLKAFMASASYVMTHGGPKQPPRSAPAPDGQPSGHEGAGAPKPYAEMTFIERHALKRRDPETYRAMKLSAVEAGEV